MSPLSGADGVVDGGQAGLWEVPPDLFVNLAHARVALAGDQDLQELGAPGGQDYTLFGEGATHFVEPCFYVRGQRDAPVVISIFEADECERFNKLERF